MWPLFTALDTEEDMNPLYVSDLDGTLLTDDATLSEFSRSELQRLLTQGVSFSVASARSVVSIRAIMQGLRLKLPVVEFNGAFLSDLETGRHRIINSLDPAVARDIYHTVTRFGCSPFVSTYNGREDCLYYRDMKNDGMGWYWLTVHDRHATKDQAIRTLTEMYGLSESELIVFGDQINDIKIFQIAAQAVAVANALPEVKLHATHIIGSNEEDSVVKYIRAHWNQIHMKGTV
jgi:hydroxymethylpyrimidine pyrophosphatase-like HAD family hydrolase